MNSKRISETERNFKTKKKREYNFLNCRMKEMEPKTNKEQTQMTFHKEDPAKDKRNIKRKQHNHTKTKQNQLNKDTFQQDSTNGGRVNDEGDTSEE